MIERNPLADVAEDPKQLQVSFLSTSPPRPSRTRSRPPTSAPERVAVSGREIYAWHPDGIQRSPLAKLLADKQLGVDGDRAQLEHGARSCWSWPTSAQRRKPPSEAITWPVTQRGVGRAQPRDQPRRVLRLAEAAGGDHGQQPRAQLVADPARVGHPGVDRVDGDAERHHLRRELAHERLQPALGGGVGQLAEHRPEVLAGDQAHDPAGLARRVAARELAAQQRRRAQVDRVVVVEHRGVERRVAGVDRVGGVVDQHRREPAEAAGRPRRARPSRRPRRPGPPRSPRPRRPPRAARPPARAPRRGRPAAP